jgi:hypothetical protein
MSDRDRARFPCSFAHCQGEGGLGHFYALSLSVVGDASFSFQKRLKLGAFNPFVG